MCGCVCMHVCVFLLPALSCTTDAQEGVVKMCWCHSTPLVYTACLDGIVRLWDARNASTVCSWEGHSSHLLDLDITKFVETTSMHFVHLLLIWFTLGMIQPSLQVLKIVLQEYFHITSLNFNTINIVNKNCRRSASIPEATNDDLITTS